MKKITEERKYKLFGAIPLWRVQTNRTQITAQSETPCEDCSCGCQKQSASSSSSTVEAPLIGTKGDQYHKEIIQRIIDEGCLDKYPSSKYGDGAPAHTYSVNHLMTTYDLSKGEMPIITLRPIAVKFAIGELLWIYQDQSNNLDVLKDKYGITWWDEWDLGDRTIGAVYGETVRRHHLVQDLLEGIKKNPDGRRHIINMWQVDDFKDKHGLKPCAYQTAWNVRHGQDGIDYLDMCLYQRSSDFMAAGCINQVQYTVFLYLVARHLGYTPGRFSWFVQNIQIYDRHLELAKKMIQREPIDCHPKIWLNPAKHDFFDFTVDDIKITGYPRKEIATQNPQMRFDLGHENIDTEGFDLEAFIAESK